MQKKPKTIDSLMKYLRDTKHISIKGSAQKRKLRNMGYFHGYKGYRFCNVPSAVLPITNFNELQALYQFDMRLKAIIYPQIMFAETALKNYALEEILNASNSIYFNDIFNKLITDYKAYPVGDKKYTSSVKSRLGLRNKIYASLSRNYDDSFIVKHYYDRDSAVPIWAIFELLTLGEFGTLLRNLNFPARRAISSSLGIRISLDSDARIVENIVFLLRDLRNSIAHNNIIFDTRFKNHIISKRLKHYFSSETGVNGITFDTIADYIVTIAYLLKLLKLPKSEIITFIKSFEKCIEDFRLQVPNSIYSRIVFTDTRNKLINLKNNI